MDVPIKRTKIFSVRGSWRLICFAGRGIDKKGDKVLSTKFNEEMQKILESFGETLSSEDNENLKADELFQEFEKILQRPKETAQ